MNEIVTEMVVVKLGLKIHANFRPTFKIIRPPQANGVFFFVVVVFFFQLIQLKFSPTSSVTMLFK